MGLSAFNRMRERQAELAAQAEAEAQDGQQDPGADEVLTDGSEQDASSEESQDIDELGYEELKALAKERGIPYGGVKKAELIEALKASE